jgi:catechol 2,3-dioxygenase-like lactoylglutathione lyase family enzyme
MAVKRIVTNIPTPQADAARRFYGAVLGLAVVMTFAAKGGSGTPRSASRGVRPNFSVARRLSGRRTAVRRHDRARHIDGGGRRQRA